MKKENKIQYFFFVSWKDGTTETHETTIEKATEMLQEIQIKKSKIKYAAIIKEEK